VYGPIDAAIDRARFAYPVLVRPFGSHGGAGLRRAASPAELPAGDAYIAPFVDFAGADGWYRKYRAIFVDGVVYPYHLAIAPRWLVHYWTAGMDADAARRAEEQRFLADHEAVLGAAAIESLAAIARRLGLDYGGIDFSVLPDGRLLVFEANATMLVHIEHNPMFAYRNPAVARIGQAFGALLDRQAMMPDVAARGAGG
jgi:hypothetical protein